MPIPDRPSSNRNRICLLLGILFFLSASIAHWMRPAIEDESDFARAAWIWFTQGANWDGLWHTPLYLECLVLWQKFQSLWTADGANPHSPLSMPVLRSFGTFCGILTATFFYLGLTRESKLKDNSKPILWTLVLLVHPYFIQSTLLLDIDNTILLPLFMAWILIFERWTQSTQRQSWGLMSLLSGLAAIALMSKELTPLGLLPLWIVFGWINRKKNKNSLLEACTGAIFSLILFGIFLKLWGQWRGFDWLAPFEMSREKIQLRQNGSTTPWGNWGLYRFLFLSYIPLLWIGFPLLWSWAKTSVSLIHTKAAPEGALFSILAGLGILVAYTWIVQASFYFPKYSSLSLVLLLYGFARFDLKSTSVQSAGPPSLKYYLSFLALLILGALPQMDPLALIDLRRTYSASLNSFSPIAFNGMSVLLPIVFVSILFKKSTQALCLGLVLYFGAQSTRQVIEWNTGDQLSGYLHGERGLKTTLDAISSLSRDLPTFRGVITTAKDISFILQENAHGFALTEPIERTKFEALDFKNTIVVSRNYGEQSLVTYPHLLAVVNQKLKCHQQIPSQAPRYLLWWDCP